MSLNSFFSIASRSTNDAITVVTRATRERDRDQDRGRGTRVRVAISEAEAAKKQYVDKINTGAVIVRNTKKPISIFTTVRHFSRLSTMQ